MGLDGIEDTGIFFNSPAVSKPLKEDSYGHTWIVVATYTLSRSEVLSQLRGEQVQLDAESLADISVIACYKCELAWAIAAHKDCPGEPKGYSSDGRPIHHQRWVREGFRAMDQANKERDV